MKFAMFPESSGNNRRWEGVITLSSDLFWYIRHNEFAVVVLEEDEWYFSELPIKAE
jgi:hypothetical protein|tara:strand:+ start:205 stop:372 length:168 start_codon:yes stop_codon:yes gene_type:complete